MVDRDVGLNARVLQRGEHLVVARDRSRVGARVEALHLTAICPHLPRLSPMVLPPQTAVTVEARYPDHRPARLSVDGVDRGIAHRMCVSADPVRLRLCYLPGHDFTATMVRKIVAV